MKRISIVLFALCFFSCKNKEEGLKEKFLPILKDTLEKERFWVSKIDSIKIYRIDEMTEMQYALKAIDNLKDSKVFYGQFKESSEDMLKSQKERSESLKFQEFTVSDIQNIVIRSNKYSIRWIVLKNALNLAKLAPLIL